MFFIFNKGSVVILSQSKEHAAILSPCDCSEWSTESFVVGTRACQAEHESASSGKKQRRCQAQLPIKEGTTRRLHAREPVGEALAAGKRHERSMHDAHIWAGSARSRVWRPDHGAKKRSKS